MSSDGSEAGGLVPRPTEAAALEAIIEAIGETRGLDAGAQHRVLIAALMALDEETIAARRRRILWAQRTQERLERRRAA